jgi:hypothetical protein
MTYLKRSRTIAFTVLLLTLFLSSCSFVRIQNVSDALITVSVRVPDNGKAYVRHIRAGQIVDVFSSHGGGYTITMMAGEQYVSSLNNLRAIIERRLFEERQTLTAEEIARLVENLNQIEKLIEDTKKPGASCSGYLPDYETVVAVVSYDDFNAEWIVNCGSGPRE